MNILIFNCGSSSLNYKLYQAKPGSPVATLAWGKAHRVSVKGSEPSFIEHTGLHGHHTQEIPLPDHPAAARLILDHLLSEGYPLEAIGHRFVHGGQLFQKAALLDETNLQKLESCLPLAPIHNPNSMKVIQECLRALPGVPQFAAFDTAFHAQLPDYAHHYALPYQVTEKYGLRKYGFHGLSYTFVTQAAAEYLHRPLSAMRIVACHLGTGGSSVAAIANGTSVDTSMGYTPLAGLMMSTRTGDLDPELPLHMQTELGFNPATLDRMFNKESGLLGVSGFSSDIRDIEKRMAVDSRARLAFDMYTYRLKQYIGAYIATLGGLDLLIFTDDVGVQSWRVRQRVCEGMAWCGIALDDACNQNVAATGISRINKPGMPVEVLAMPTDEEIVICQQGLALLGHSGFPHPVPE